MTPLPSPHSLAPSQADYKVELDVYSGPLELLLYLIRREEVDIKDIPIAHITRQYLHHVELLSRIDINLAGEFLVMAATLMEIKSRMLIPKLPTAADQTGPDTPIGDTGGGGGGVEDLADPRYELVKQLLAYKAFKDAASTLKRRADTEAARFPRSVPRPEGRAPLAIEDLDLFRLIDAFNAIMSSLGHSAYGHEVVYDDTPISLHQADILDRILREPNRYLTLRELFQGRSKKSEMIGLFLATLELIRQKKITISQPETLGEITLSLVDHSTDPPSSNPPADDETYPNPSPSGPESPPTPPGKARAQTLDPGGPLETTQPPIA